MESGFTVGDFRKRLRELRKAQGYSQEGFALTVELDRTYIGGIERGERNRGLRTILRIAEALGVPAAELFGGR